MTGGPGSPLKAEEFQHQANTRTAAVKDSLRLLAHFARRETRETVGRKLDSPSEEET
jgi:hypothetical protein